MLEFRAVGAAHATYSLVLVALPVPGCGALALPASRPPRERDAVLHHPAHRRPAPGRQRPLDARRTSLCALPTLHH
jgi:hypothetical protein